MSRPVLCLVTDRAATRRPLAEAVEAAARAGVDWLQVRERGLESAALLDHVCELAEAGRRGNPQLRVLVNRRVDVALAADLDGVHLGFDAMPAESARRLLGPDALLGVATHAPQELAEAAAGPVSYAHLAPIFPPISKPASRAPLGPEALAGAGAHGILVLAQGGIDPDRAGLCITAGAAGVAVTGEILGSDDPGGAAARLRAALDRSAKPSGC